MCLLLRNIVDFLNICCDERERGEAQVWFLNSEIREFLLEEITNLALRPRISGRGNGVGITTIIVRGK